MVNLSFFTYVVTSYSMTLYPCDFNEICTCGAIYWVLSKRALQSPILLSDFFYRSPNFVHFGTHFYLDNTAKLWKTKQKKNDVNPWLYWEEMLHYDLSLLDCYTHKCSAFLIRWHVQVRGKKLNLFSPGRIVTMFAVTSERGAIKTCSMKCHSMGQT